ncbi:AfsR/SARP family transcriptional regulator [Sphaerisporangium dianthi]|uniref:BTAD domain-containing putative transcriptional regulator n=1 Tax=Sphaerisporangium dianthi TaxID=1436120 RepID=A0ABV9CTD0_9ACTN
MEFRILGTVEVATSSGVTIRIGGPKVRTLLAVLLLRANTSIRTDRLVDVIWDGHPPRSAMSTVHAYVSRLRSRLAAAGADGADRIVTDAQGYRIRVAPHELDAESFRQHVDRARAVRDEGAAAAAGEEFDAALRLWRGPALADISAGFVHPHAASLNEKRAEVMEERLAIALDTGQPELVAELRKMVLVYPTRERLTGLLMLALYRAGRPAEALRAFQAICRRFREELGMTPGRELQTLHQQILTDTVAPPKPAGVPLAADRNLPPDLVDFTGRTEQVHRLTKRLTDTGTATAVYSITGMAGVGKTALAIHVAHLVADRYPDGQLFLDLRAHRTDSGAIRPDAALETLLLMIGVPRQAVPDTLELRAALWRTQMAHRRAMVVLDDAASLAQIESLLPGNKDCVVLVTSRHQLSGLATTDTVPVEPLSLDGATHLFTTIVGRNREIPAEDEIRDTASLCSCVPLAVRAAADRFVSRPAWSVGDLNRWLADTWVVRSETVSRDVRTGSALAGSFHLLDEALRDLLVSLVAYPDSTFDVDSAAAWVGMPTEKTSRRLEALVDRSMLESPHYGTYRFNALVWAYAYGQAVAVRRTA